MCVYTVFWQGLQPLRLDEGRRYLASIREKICLQVFFPKSPKPKSLITVHKGALSHSVAKLTRFCIPIEENRSHRHHRPKPLSFNATLEAMRHHHSTVTLLTFRSPPPTTVRRRHRPVRFRRRPIEASVTVIIRGSGWTVLHTQRSH